MKEICIMHDERCPGMSTFACPRGLWFLVFTHHSGGGNLHSRAESPSHHGATSSLQTLNSISTLAWSIHSTIYTDGSIQKLLWSSIWNSDRGKKIGSIQLRFAALTCTKTFYTNFNKTTFVYIHMDIYFTLHSKAMATDRCNCSVTIVQEPGCCPCPSCESRNNPMSMWKAPSSSQSGLRRHWIGDCGGWTLHDSDW